MQTYHGPPAAWVSEDARMPLQSALWQAFGRTAALLPSPALTGRHLLSLSRMMENYPPLPDDVQRLIRANSGQGRVEVTTPAAMATIPSFHYLDMRLAYAASAESLPCGAWEHRGKHEFDRYTKGRYHIKFRVPRHWEHVGIFMEKDILGWKFPNEPGYIGETWASNGEIALAQDYGWQIEMVEAITFAGPRRGAPAPLDAWIQRLTRIHEGAGSDAVRAAVRAIILHTIGAFHSPGRNETVIIEADMAATIPPGALAHLRADGKLQYKRFVPMPAHLQGFMHPEWSAEIWARCRTRLLRFQRQRGREMTDAWGALTVPRDHVLGFRIDALYLTRDPGWRDYAEVGNFRLKGSILDERPAPRSLDALVALRKEAEGVGSD